MDILVGNDDGFQSKGVDILARHAMRLGEVVIIAPERQQTATSKGLTFQDPLRIHTERSSSGMEVLAHNGLPADSVPIYEQLHGGLPDLVLSGINGGENTSIHSILTSGTCAVAMEAGLRDIPSFAVSMDVPEEFFFSKNHPFDLEHVAEIAVDIAAHYLRASEEFWSKTLFVNVNFPHELNSDTTIEVADLETYKYNNYLEERTDPKGQKYYWLWGRRRTDLDRTKDSYKVLYGNTVTITPVMLRATNSLVQEARELLDDFTWNPQ